MRLQRWEAEALADLHDDVTRGAQSKFLGWLAAIVFFITCIANGIGWLLAIIVALFAWAIGYYYGALILGIGLIFLVIQFIIWIASLTGGL